MEYYLLLVFRDNDGADEDYEFATKEEAVAYARELRRTDSSVTRFGGRWVVA